MCGIVGFFKHSAGTEPWADAMLPELIWANQMRGRDAVGIFSKHKDRAHIDLLKMVGPADEFNKWDQPHARIYKDAESRRFVVAHNRAATIGAKDDVNAAHPHQTDNITLVHNGTLTMNKEEREKYISDSAMVAAMLEENPDFNAVERRINGPYVFVWHDRRDDSLNFVKNYGRPLGFVETASGAVWFASETKMLEWILHRRGKSIQRIHQLVEFVQHKFLPDGKLTEIPIETHYQQSFGQGTYVEWWETEEGKAAAHRIRTGDVRSWKETSVETGPLPPVVVRPNSLSSSEGGDSKLGPVRIMTEWCSLSKGAKVYFYPLTIVPAATDKDRTQLAGPLLLWQDSGSPEFIDGVEVRGRLNGELDRAFGNFLTMEKVDAKMRELNAQEVIHEAEIVNVTKDTRRNKVTLWVKESTPQDWWSFPDFEMSPRAAEDAWNEEYDLETLDDTNAAPEVAAQEKKL